MVNVNKLKGEIASKGLTQKSVYDSIGLSRKQWTDRMKKRKFDSEEIYKILAIIGRDNMPIFFE